MAAIYGFGNTLVSERRLDLLTENQLRGLTARAGPRTSALRDGATAFTPIGLGKPLSVEIAYVSTGALSSSGFFRNKPDLLITSAVKRLPIFESAPRGINLLAQGVEKGFRFSDMAATQPGTPLIYYSPALTDRGTAVTVEFAFDSFAEDTFSHIGSLLGSAAGIPLFAPASSYLMAGGVLVKLFAQIAEKLVDGKQAFAETLPIDIDRPGYGNTQADFVILTNSSDIESLVESGKLAFVAKEGLRNTTTRKPYDGAGAYVVLSLDGSERPDYASFAPTMAGAALLDRFLHTGEKRPASTDLIMQSMKAFNDLHFRGKAEGMKKRIAEVGQDSDEGKKLKLLFDAYVKNISDGELQPKLLS